MRVAVACAAATLLGSLAAVSGAASASAGSPVASAGSPVPDPEEGGPVSLEGARGVVGRPDLLGEVHTDPMPAGVSLSDPTDTGTLLRRAEVSAAAPAADRPVTTGSTSPLGTPGIRSLSRHVKPSCSGTGRDGNRVQVLYVREAHKASRYAQVLPILGNEVANVDDVFALSARQTGGERRVRWVHDAACLPVIGEVVVPDGSLGPSFWTTISALKRLGYQDRHRKYLVFADAAKFCGIGTVYEDTRRTGNQNDGAQASYARVDSPCWSSGESVAAHELTHTLGGVQADAPHATTHGHCFDESDLMCYDDGSHVPMRKVCPAAQEQLLDCHHDDYFNTHPAPGSYLARSWDTARSTFLDRVVRPPAPTARLTAPGAAHAGSAFAVRVAATGSGSLTVTWSAGGCTVSEPSGRATTVSCPEGTPTQTLPVSVRVRQADGRTVRASSTVRLSGAVAPPPQPAADRTAWSGPALADGALTVSLRDGAGAALARRPVTLEVRWTGAAGWVAARRLTTSSSGLVTVRPRYPKAGRFRFVSPADPFFGRSVSAPTFVPGATRLRLSARAGHRVRGSLRTLTGSPVAHARVTLQRHAAGTPRWVSVVTLRTAADGHVTRRVRPVGTTYFRWVFRGDRLHLGSRSGQHVVR